MSGNVVQRKPLTAVFWGYHDSGEITLRELVRNLGEKLYGRGQRQGVRHG